VFEVWGSILRGINGNLSFTVINFFKIETVTVLFGDTWYVKKLNYPSIWLKKWNLHIDYAVCLLLVTKLNHWPSLPVMCVTKLDHHSI